VAPTDLDDGIDVGEVDHLRDIGLRQARRVGVPVDGDDPEAELPHSHDRTPLVAPGADEENCRHARRL
jgi:hypothetical protein